MRMTKGLGAGLMAAAALGGCAAAPAAPPVASASALPPFVSQADVCAILARAEAPGAEETADPVRRGRAEEILRAARWQSVPWRYDRRRRAALGAWGRCAGPTGGAYSLSFSADGRHARTEGGYQAAPLHGGWGHCIFEKSGGGTWELVACEVTAVS
jgi:hypothetical protein